MSPPPLLLHVFPTFGIGGSQARFAAIANHFSGRYRHAIVAMDGAYDCFGRLAANVEAERWDVPAPKRNTVGNVLTFRRLLRARKPDLLVTYNWGAIEWALANRPQIVPHMHIEDGFGSEEAERQLPRRVLTRRWALAKSTVVLPSCTLHRLALNSWRLPANRVRHIPNGIDVERFSAAANPIALPAGRSPVIGTVAALRPEKNVGRLLRAFASVRQKAACRLVIVGDGPERTALEAQARQLLPGGTYLFTGHVDAVERAYSAFDVYALTSDTEQMPTSLMEAMASGLPVVATDVGDVAAMVADANRLFVVPVEESAVAGALSRLVSDSALRRAIGASNHAIAYTRYCIQRMLSDYGREFTSLMRGFAAQ